MKTKEQVGTLFSGEKLKKLVVPLIIEQTLAMTVGMADTMMIASRGEAAMSGVSIVDSIAVLMIGLFSALATGGAVVASQFIGQKDIKNANKAANQLVVVMGSVALFLMAVALLFNKQILNLIYGTVEPDVMAYARTYFYISAASFPFLSLYNAGAALFRAMGNSKISMKVSLIMNGINVFGNAFFLFVMNMSVEGVALATLISRIVAAIIIMLLIRKPDNLIHIDPKFRLGFNWKIIKRILNIGVPNGLENSVFQVGKLMVQGIVASFGTTSIAANAMANTIAGVAIIPGSALGMAMITVVGQCVGADDEKQMRYYTKKLLLIAYGALFVLNIAVMLGLDGLIWIYNLESATGEIARQLIVLHTIFTIFLWPLSFVLPNALRAANDVKFTMVASMVSMWTFRILFSYILAKGMQLGVLGVWISMFIDWCFRSLCYTLRFFKGGYRKFSFAVERAHRH